MLWFQNALEPMQVDIHMEDNDNFEDEHEHIVDNSSIVSYFNCCVNLSTTTVLNTSVSGLGSLRK